MANDDLQMGGRGEANPDDLVLPFRAELSGVNGRLVRLGAVVDGVLRRHDYPEPVSVALGEALVLTAMLGTSLKHGSRLTLQTQTDGPLHLIVVDFEPPGRVRGYAGFDRSSPVVGDGTIGQGVLLGHGHLAMTIDPGEGMDLYQGVVPIENDPLTKAALTYFRQSEQLPTFIRLAVARHYKRPLHGAADGWRWRAGGLMLQHLATEGGHEMKHELGDDEELPLLGDDDEDWERTRFLAETVQDYELLDPTLAPERLLLRLFHEEGVRAYSTKPVEERCKCSEQRIRTMLSRFGASELSDMIMADGRIRVTCEFCSSVYYLMPDELGVTS